MMIKERILIVGCNPVAFEVGLVLQKRGLRFVMIDDSNYYIDEAKKHGFDVVITNISDDEKLLHYGIGESVTTLYALFEEDEKNIFITISARFLDKSLEIIALTQTHDTISKLYSVGANTVLDPYEISANRIHQMLNKPEVVSILDNTFFSNSSIEITEIEIQKNSIFEGKQIEEIDLKNQFSLLLLGIIDLELSSKMIFWAEGIDHKIDAGDVLVVIGLLKDIEHFKSSLYID
jgi:voltage-gated potassium channel